MKPIQDENCIVHCRVSSPKQAQEGESLEVQENICRGIVGGKGWRIVPDGKVWRENFSGRKERRPVFAEIIAYLDKHPGEVKYYLFRAIDRFTRGGSFSYETMKRELARRGVQMVDTYGIIQPSKNTLEDLGFEYDWSAYSPSEITELVVSSTAKTEVTTILTRMIGQEIRLTQQGYKIRQAQDGYKNEKVYVEGKKRTIQVPDPERARFYIEMFNLRDSGQHTDQEIVDRINSMGFRSRTQHRWDKSHERIIGQKGGKPLTVKQLQSSIQKPIYAGVVCEKWTRYLPVKAQYEGLVSIPVFNRANRGIIYIQADGQRLQLLRNLGNTARSRIKHNPLFPYKSVILCPKCKRPMLASSSRGKSGRKFPAYHCSRRHKYFGVPKATFEQTVEQFITKLRFRPEALASLEAVLIDRFREQQSAIATSAASVGKNAAELEARKADALRSYITATSPIVKAGIEKEIEALDFEIKSARGERNQLEVTEQDIHAFVREAKSIMEHPAQLLLNPVNTRQRRSLYNLVFDGLPDYQEIVSGTPKMTWIFQLSSANANAESLTVGLRGLGWNTIESTILRWKQSLESALDARPSEIR